MGIHRNNYCDVFSSAFCFSASIFAAFFASSIALRLLAIVSGVFHVGGVSVLLMRPSCVGIFSSFFMTATSLDIFTDTPTLERTVLLRIVIARSIVLVASAVIKSPPNTAMLHTAIFVARTIPSIMILRVLSAF